MTVAPETLRATFLIGGDLVLDLLEVARGDLDLTDLIIVLAIVQANTDPISARADLQERFAGIGDLAPDEARRHVNVTSVSESTHIAFETVRRRVRDLVGRGVVEKGPDGLIVPARYLSSQAHVAALEGAVARLREALVRLSELGLAPPGAGRIGPDRARVAARASSDYFLRMVAELGGITGSAPAGLIFLSVVLMSPGSPGPVSMAQVARALRLDHSRVRRHVARLLAAGWLSKSKGGLVAPSALLQGAAMARLEVRALSHLRALFRRLGVSIGDRTDAARAAPD